MPSKRSKTKASKRRPKKGLNRLLWSADTHRAKVIIGARPGANQCWRSRRHAERCTDLGSSVSGKLIQEHLTELRAKQVGAANVSLTKYSTRGYYKGGEEPSYVFDIIDDTSSGTKFKKHMRQLAEGLSKAFCQDEVLVEYVAADGATSTKSYLANACKTPGGAGSKYTRPRGGTQGVQRTRRRAR
jgi:hypothetical protein